MSYTLEEIKADLEVMDDRQFYLKHIVRSDNWYFENVLKRPKEELTVVSDDFRMIISETLGVEFNSIMLVGSGKVGYSFSPTDKLFSPFCVDGAIRKESDLDVAIISSEFFYKFWSLFRKYYASKYSYWYNKFIYCGIYRGYINEKWIDIVDGCRHEWAKTAAESKRRLTDKLFIQHEVTYRIYRSWEDFEEYNLKNIAQIREKMLEV